MTIEITMKDTLSGMIETLNFSKEGFVDLIKTNPNHLISIIENSEGRFRTLSKVRTNTRESFTATTILKYGKQ